MQSEKKTRDAFVKSMQRTIWTEPKKKESTTNEERALAKKGARNSSSKKYKGQKGINDTHAHNNALPISSAEMWEN